MSIANKTKPPQNGSSSMVFVDAVVEEVPINKRDSLSKHIKSDIVRSISGRLKRLSVDLTAKISPGKSGEKYSDGDTGSIDSTSVTSSDWKIEHRGSVGTFTGSDSGSIADVSASEDTFETTFLDSGDEKTINATPKHGKKKQKLAH
jgi:hypothetical protein